MEKQYKISVIIPIYNVEKYIEETIQSVINQTIGFKENIQLILINDGSPDNSEAICLKYKSMYPENVIYIAQENAGVSNARNNAKKYAKGELVTFLDSDDKWSRDSFKCIYDFWKKHKEVKVLTCKMKFFDAKKGDHPLNYKYEKNKIVDIRKDYKYIQSSTCSCFVERDTLKNYEYDATIKYSEDTKLINQILLDTYYMAVLKKPTYYYRRRKEQNSAAQVASNRETWYNVTPEAVYNYLIKESKQKHGKVLDCIQYLCAYEIGWRLKTFNEDVMKEFKEDYVNTLDEIIKHTDINMFNEQKHLSTLDNIYILNIKENANKKKLLEQINGKMYCKALNKYVKLVVIDDLYVRDNKIYLYGRINKVICNIKKLKLLVNQKQHNLEFYELHKNFDEISYRGEHITEYIGIKSIIDLTKTKEFGFVYGDNKEYIKLEFSNRSMLNATLCRSFYTVGNKMLTYTKGTFEVKKNLFIYKLKREIMNILKLLKTRKLKQLLIRCGIMIVQAFGSKNIWIISDRVNMANDNAEHFFNYLCENKFKKVKPYFVISKCSTDYERMKKIGRVVDPASLKYKMLFVKAKYIVSSHAEEYITNIFGRNMRYYRNLLKFKYVFLQHGITQNDLSAWLNPNTKRIDMFVTAAKGEYDSILTYGYTKDSVKLTGFTRYDGLLSGNEPKKLILIQPTWRASLANKIDRLTGKRVYNPEFKQTEFFKFYNNLINDERLINYLKEKGYKIRFCPHPNLLVQIDDFDTNEILDIEKGEINYQKEFKEAAMLVTDYSSVFFDVAYLKKPVVYSQFDKDTFYEGQIYNRGYFEYEKDGFGPIAYDVDGVVDNIIKIVDSGCKMDKEYVKRVDKFYYKFDTKNCERVYKEIVNLK